MENNLGALIAVATMWALAFLQWWEAYAYRETAKHWVSQGFFDLAFGASDIAKRRIWQAAALFAGALPVYYLLAPL